MLVSGLPHSNGNRHAAEVANTALNLLEEVARFKIKHKPDHTLQLRIGIHTGSCAAGVCGNIICSNCPRGHYLFGWLELRVRIMVSFGVMVSTLLGSKWNPTPSINMTLTLTITLNLP